MKTTRFLISSLIMAGFGSFDPAIAQQAAEKAPADGDPNRQGLFKQFTLDHAYVLAQHRSHRSHSSHRSHRSSASGGYSAPSYPVYTPTPAPAPAPVRRSYSSPTQPPSVYRSESSEPSPFATLPAPAPDGKIGARPLSGRSELFTSIVKRVQLGLLAYGYHDGPINGVVDAGTKASIRRFQAEFKLPVTGTITPGVLDALRIEAR